jgi:hypothetical protein
LKLLKLPRGADVLKLPRALVLLKMSFLGALSQDVFFKL